MKFTVRFACILAVIAAIACQSNVFAQQVVANVNTLRTTNLSGNSYIILQGYFGLNDGGGGMLYQGSGTNSCQFTIANGATNIGVKTITFQSGTSLAGIALQMGISGTGIPANDVIDAFDTTPTAPSITLHNAATGTGTHVTVTLSGDNGGTIFKDSVNNCFSRVSMTYNQIEWGAAGDCCSGSSHDDTPFLQNWLNAAQPHVAVPGNSLITQPLFCSNPFDFNNYNGVIQGPPPNSPGADGNPTFLITAGDQAGHGFTFPSSTAMLTMTSSPSGADVPCAVSSVGLVGSQSGNYYIIDAKAKHSAVFNHSLLQGGTYGFYCDNSHADVEIYDSSISNTGSDGINCGAPNTKFLRNIISSAGGDGISYAGSQGLIEENIIEQNGGNGLHCNGGFQLAVVGNYFDNNGKIPGSHSTNNLRSAGCQVVSIVGNQFHRSSQADQQQANPSAQVWFEGTNDTVSMSGNTNFAGSTPDATVQRPDYDVELSPNAVVTNFSYSDSPTPMNKGVFGPNAMAILGPFLTTNTPQNYLTGLTTQNGSTGTQVMLNSGAATDSSNTQLLTLASTCTVDLSTSGMGGLDIGGSVQPNTTYNFFLVVQGGYASSGNCIASKYPAPDFYSASLGAVAPPHVTLYGYMTSDGTNKQIVNVTAAACSGTPLKCPNQNPFAGIAPGDAITDANGQIQAGTTISSFTPLNVSAFQATTFANSPVVGITTGLPSNLYVGEMVGNCTANNPTSSCSGASIYKEWISNFAIIQSISTTASCTDGTNTVSAPCFVMSANASVAGSGSTPAYLTAGGAYTIKLSTTIIGTNVTTPDTLTVYNDRYRMVAALVTSGGGSPAIPAYRQVDDTFYLAVPSPDINGPVNTSATTFSLAAAPTGIATEALGRCVGTTTSGGTDILLYSPLPTSTSPGAPANFPTSPGYSIKTTATGATTATYPYRLYTDTSTHLIARANVSSTLQCMTDGWVWHRGK